jgi:hypothetical protein
MCETIQLCPHKHVQLNNDNNSFQPITTDMTEPQQLSHRADTNLVDLILMRCRPPDENIVVVGGARFSKLVILETADAEGAGYASPYYPSGRLTASNTPPSDPL